MVSKDDLNKLKAIQALWEQYPGAAPGGTGLTGLSTNDAQGWSNLQNQNTWALQKQREVEGKDPYQIKFGGFLGGMPPNLAEDPNWYSQVQKMNPLMHVGGAANLMSGGAVQGLKQAYTPEQKKQRQQADAEVKAKYPGA